MVFCIYAIIPTVLSFFKLKHCFGNCRYLFFFIYGVANMSSHSQFNELFSVCVWVCVSLCTVNVPYWKNIKSSWIKKRGRLDNRLLLDMHQLVFNCHLKSYLCEKAIEIKHFNLENLMVIFSWESLLTFRQRYGCTIEQCKCHINKLRWST